MPENDRLDSCSSDIELGFVERKATPRLPMELIFNSILLVYYFRIPSLFLEMFDVYHVRSTVHNRVHKAELQPESGRSPDYAAVDETVIRLDDEQY